MTREEAIETLTPRRWSPSNGFSNMDSAQNYIGETVDGYIVLTQTRDSDALTRSNWAVGEERLPGADIHRFGHWMCGWVEHLTVPTDAPDELLIAAAQIVEDIEAYPVLSDDHYSNLECEEAYEYWSTASLRTRVELCRHHGVSIFAARHDDIPETPSGELCTYQ
jgi:hypothetical protein